MHALPINTRLQDGKLAVSKPLGQGGFGITYYGGDVQLRRYIAIKEFFPQGCTRQANVVQANGVLNENDFSLAKRKFLEEARVLAQFRHQGIVQVYGFFEENNTAYIVMEYLQGKTLAQLVEERGALPEKEAVGYIEKAADALEEVHRTKHLHRDIKPENIMVCDDGRVVLIDFGLTKKVEEAVGLGTRRLTNPSSHR